MCKETEAKSLKHNSYKLPSKKDVFQVCQSSCSYSSTVRYSTVQYGGRTKLMQQILCGAIQRNYGKSVL